VELIYPTECKI